jgi:hypothetical protein
MAHNHGTSRKYLTSAVAVVVLLAAVLFAAPAVYANHPQDDIKDRVINDEPQPALDGWEDAICDQDTVTNPYDGIPHWGSLDGQMWDCVDDPYAPPGVPDRFWQPSPYGNVPGKAETAWSVRWDPVTIPGYPGVMARLSPRTEWVNPYNRAETWPNDPPEGVCPTVPGGCKFKGGGDINLFRNGQPFLLHKTWFNRALQVYVYNATTKVWEKKHDTGWQMNGAAAPTYTDTMTATWDYGTAPYGNAYYFVRAQSRFWNGSAWSTPIVADPNDANGALDYVWDDKPGDATPKPAKPKTKAPKAEKPSKSLIQPDVSEPTADAVEVPQS